MGETRAWTWHMAAGLAMFVLLGLHMTTMHLGGLTGLFVSHPAETATALVNSQARDASVWFTGGYIALLAIALFHGLYGLRTILFELTLRPAMERAITAALVVLGLGLFGLGSWASAVAHGRAVLAGG